MDAPFTALRSFCVVAQELHFAAAAARLRITPPSLSQQIARLETGLGVRLFERTPRRVVLTPAGEELLPLARRARDDHDAILAWAAARAGGGALLRIGMVAAGAGELSTRILMDAVERIPDVRLEMRRLGFFDTVAELRADRVDAVFAPGPIAADPEEVTALELGREQRVLVVPSTHRLADRAAITIAETAGEVFVSPSGGDAATLDWWLVDPRPDGARPRRGPVADDFEGLLELCAAGAGVNIAAASAARHYRREGLSFVPIEDIPEATILLCTRARQSPTVERFVDIAHAAMAGA